MRGGFVLQLWRAARLDAALGLKMLAGLAFLGFTLKAAVADHRGGILPLADVIGMATAGGAFATFEDATVLIEHAWLALAIAGIGHALWWSIRAFTQKAYFGRGDWNYMAAAALGLGGVGTWLAAAVGLAAALLLAAIGLQRHGHHGGGYVALGPYLCAGIVLATLARAAAWS